MKAIILYGSEYGTTRRYAEALSERTGIEAVSYDKQKDLSGFDKIIYMGGLYAGGVKGLKETVGKLPDPGAAQLTIVTVGLADTADEENIANIRSAIKKQVPAEIYELAGMFHLRGGIDYRELSMKHRAMMTLLYHKVKNLPEEKKNAETRAMIETFNQKVDFVDFSTLDAIVESI